MTDASHYRDLVRSVVEDRDWIVAMGILYAAADNARTLLELGAARALAIGASRGTGPLPDDDRIQMHDLGVVGSDLMTSIRNGMDAVANLPADVRAAVDALDPERRARVVTEHFSDDRPVGDRLVYGARPAAWQALEDKVTVDGLWDRARVPRAPVEVVAPDRESISSARDRIGSGGADVVVAGDSRDGFNGGAEYVRWIRTEEHLDEAAEFFGAHCDRVRVMPLLDGVVCSIHGIVFPDEVATFRPCEMIVMRDPAAGRFVYASVSTFWDAGPDVTREMRGVAERVGVALREDHAYRGAFTVDGVLTRDGFRPTELNPRFGAGFHTMARGMPDCPLYLLDLALREGEDLDWRPRELERLVRESAEQNPVGGGARLTSRRIDDEVTGALVLENDHVRLAAEGEPADARYIVGPGPTGGRCRVELVPERTPRGALATPRIARLLEFVGEHHDLDLSPME
ncbi:MAG: hypothetical protein AAF957_25855 [Planctomycetota bacterium]